MPEELQPKIESVQHLLIALQELPMINEPHAHTRVWFRGQPDALCRLAPGVYRDDFPENTEPGRLKLEQHLTQESYVSRNSPR